MIRTLLIALVLPLTVWADRVSFPDSVRNPGGGAANSSVHAQIAESTTAHPWPLMISLRLRNYARLQAILQHGGTVTRDEMEQQFLPHQTEYDHLAVWLQQQGFQITLQDSRHTHLVVSGSAAAVAAAFQVQVASVTTPQGARMSAVSAPSLPQELAAEVLGIAGLQPELEVASSSLPSPAAFVHPVRAIPADLAAAYHVPAGLTGAGQTIAVFADNTPLQSDLAFFFTECGIATPAPIFSVVPINGGPYVTGPNGAAFSEVTMDAQWSSGLAPAANLVIYACPSGGATDFLATCASIASTGGVNFLTSSFSNPEPQLAPSVLQACSQALAQLAAAGVTVFHGAGDTGGYAGSTLPEYPTTDPYVFALGGTTQTFNANWTAISEVAWPTTGGGYSTYFPTPVWQQGPGVPANAYRAVPDAAAPSSMVAPGGQEFSFIVLNGATNVGIGGDSHCGPVWAGLGALINQARASAGLPAMGLLSPKVYPLIGTAAFFDITSGNNGVFNAGPGYDLCSGVGTPNVAALIAALAAEPTVTVQPQSETIQTGSTLALNAFGVGSPAPAYQWYCNGAPIAGATSPRLVIPGATAANAGAYTCSLTNSILTTSTQSAVVTVTASSTPGHLSNVSVLSQASAASPLTVGFVTGGAGTSGLESLLMRGSGPALTTFGVAAPLADPVITLYQSGAVIGGNDNWGTQAAQVTAADLATGAFALTAGSLDAALVASLGSSGYSLIVTGNGAAAGSTIAEVYDATPGPFTPSATHLINLSCRGQVTATSSLTAGFVIAGATSKTVLVRATGPALAGFGVPGTLADPSVALHGQVAGADAVLTSDSGWSGDPQLAAAAAAVQAFPLNDPNSHDSAVLITLAPGNYSAVVSSSSGGSGTALVEIYDVP